MNVDADHIVNTGVGARRSKGIHARAGLTVEFTEYQSLQGAAVPDDAGLHYRSSNIAQAPDHVITADDLRDPIDSINAILERDHGSLRTDDRANSLRGCFGIPKLHRDDHNIYRRHAVHALDRVHAAQVYWSNGALDAQTIPLYRSQVLSARDERQSVTRCRQSGAEVAAEAAGAHHHDIQNVRAFAGGIEVR